MDGFLTELEGLFEKKSSLETQLAGLEAREGEIRTILATQMGKSGIKSLYSPNKKLTVTIKSTKSLSVVDEATVRTFLQSRGVLDECLRLDLPAVKKFAKREEIPGMAESERETLSITPIKDKPEKVTDEETPAQFRERVRAQTREAELAG